MNIRDILEWAAEERGDKTVLRFRRDRRWQERSYSELRSRARLVAEICAGLGIQPGDRVSIHLENSPEWYELYYGIVSIGATVVPVDVKLRESEAGHIFHDCGVAMVFGSLKSAEMIYECNGRHHAIKRVVVLDDGGELPESNRIEFLRYSELCEQYAVAAASEGRAFDRCPPEPDMPASFIYTSGTTGRPKGAVLTHRNFLSNCESCAEAIEIREDDNFMLVLPLHHSFAFLTTLLLPVYAKCEVSLVESLKVVKKNMKDCSPTVLLAVPLLLEKMLARIMAGVEEKTLARLMMRVGLSKVIGKKIQAELGGALRLIISGGAPIAPESLVAWEKLGFCISEGYGITETAPVISFNPLGNPRHGTVGLPLPNLEVRIDEPNAEGVGEICVKGPNVMQGYFDKPEETEKVLRDGWYHTGDLGHFDEAGYLVISGRKKSLIVNREGKNIYPEEVEHWINLSPYVLESLALGYREEGETVGERVGLIAVPNPEAFDALEDKAGRRYSDKEIEEKVRAEIAEQLQHLSPYKRPRRIQVHFTEFEKTTTQKIKRFLYAIDTSAE